MLGSVRPRSNNSKKRHRPGRRSRQRPWRSSSASWPPSSAQHDANVLETDPELPELEEELEALAEKIATASDADETTRPGWVQTAAGGTIDALAWLVGDGADAPPAVLGERGGVVARAVAQRRQRTGVESVETFVIGGLAGVIEGCCSR